MHKVTNKLWNLLTFRHLPSLCLLIMSALCFTTVVTEQPVEASVSWWSIPLRHPEVLAALAVLGFLTIASFFCGLSRSGAASSVAGTDRAATLPYSKAQILGIVLIMIGCAAVGADWLISQRGIPPARVTMPTGKWAQEYTTESTNFDVLVMLPSEVSLAAIRTEQTPPVIDIQFRKDKSTNPDSQLLTVFQPLLVERNYWTLIGTEYSDASIRAVITPESKDAIPAAGSVGDTLQFTINGPKYTIDKILFDEFPELGPTVHLTDEGGNSFTVFMKPQPKIDGDDGSGLPSSETLPHFGHGFWLSAIEAAPLATVMVAPEPPVEWLLTGLVIAVAGILLLMIVSDSSTLLGIRILSQDPQDGPEHQPKKESANDSAKTPSEPKMKDEVLADLDLEVAP